MKTIKINLYEFNELSDKAKEHAIEQERRRITETGDYPWMDETFESLKAIIESAGIKLKDWSLDPYRSGSYIELEFPKIYEYDDCFKIHGDYAEELVGKRAYAWLENNLFGHLRIPFKGKKRWDSFKYGKDHRPGHIPACPLTGYFADEEFISSLLDSVRRCESIAEAFKGLVKTYQYLIKQEIIYAESDENISEILSINEYCFTDDGELY